MSALTRGVVSASAFLIAVAGCSTEAASVPPIRVPSSTVGSGPRPTVAPPVTRTLDLASYHTRPCELLKPDQRGPFDRPPLAEKDLLERCTFDASVRTSSVTVILGLDGDYLNEVFRVSNERKYQIFEPFTIGQQPAVMINSPPRRTECEVVVGTGPRDSIQVMATGQAMSEDACITAATIAQRVIGNLGG
jgi:hypothetical protein